MPARARAAGWAVVALAACAGPIRMIAAAEKPDVGAKAEEMVTLNFSGETDLKVLVDYVSQRLGVQILYDEKISNKKVNISAPRPIAISSLLAVLDSALRMKSLVLLDSDPPGWKRIVERAELPRVAPTGDAATAIERFGQGTAVTQVFALKHANPEQVAQSIKQFLSDPAANTVALPQSRTLVVTDYATTLLTIGRWIEQMDQPNPAANVAFVPVVHSNASEMAEQIQQVLAAKSRFRGGAKAESEVQVIGDARTNQLLVIGPTELTEEVRALVQSLDVPSQLTTQTYAFQHVDAGSVDRLAKQLVGPDAGRTYRSAVVSQENLLVVTATEEIHRRIEDLRASRDTIRQESRTPIRFYKVKNLPVNELLTTIQAITGAAQSAGQTAPWRRLATDGRIRPAREDSVSGPNRMPAAAGGEPPAPPAARESNTSAAASEKAADSPPAPTRTAGDSGSNVSPPTAPSPREELSTGELLGLARVSADINTNTLIVVAEPSVQRAYSELIKQLDERRPQVLIEARFVIINLSDDCTLGVEVSGGDRGGKRLFSFTSYGLSDVDSVSGALSIVPGLGLNGVLVDPKVADAVLRAVTTHKRARVLSSPRILVNDNSTGQLTSVAEVPFTSVNASQTVATTSFAGFAEAGTTITVTPHISDEDRLQLDFAITVNTFTGAGAEGVPPPRQTQEVTSQITIPDGHTLVVGGLSQGNRSDDYKGLPVLDRVPIVRNLFGMTSWAESHSSMFVFLRPIILRDDKFQDLKFISQRDAERALLEPSVPMSKPIWIE